MSKINFEIKGLGKLIKENNLKVPIYQRPFAWEEKQVEELLNDIKESINEEEYFLGTIVLTRNEGESRLEIVDGQQRITSIVIFFATLKKFITEDEESSNKIQSDYLSDWDYRERTNIPKLELSKQDNDFFREFIINENIKFPGKILSHQRIQKAFEISKKIVLQLLESNNNDLNILYDWKEFIDEKLKVVLITVPSGANAFTIFETLNDRGLELAQIDLLKNYLYSKAVRRLEESQNSWMEMRTKIESVEDESVILTYIKHHWASQYGFVRLKNKELYINIKNKVKNSTQVITFINNLKNDADIYLAILNHNNSYWNDFDNKCKEYIETLNYFGLEQYRPLLLSILKNFSKGEVKKSLKFIVSWLIRNLITQSMGGGTLEQTYANKAKEIHSKKIKKATELRESLKDLVPQDVDFKERFKTATISKQKYARYFLQAIENNKRDKDHPELLVNTNPDSVNLEHILPQNPGNNWPNFNEEIVNAYIRRIGNLTLMKTRENNEFKNSSFVKKKNKYEKSELWITNSIAMYDDWTIESISKRQNELANLAVKTWSLKFE